MGSLNTGVLFVLGIGVFGGIFGGLIFQKLKIPQVIAYIILGIIIGQSVLKIIDVKGVETFQVFTTFALGIIGFQVGGELYWETMKKYGKQFSGILLGEGILSFMLVGGLTAVIVYLVTWNIAISLAAGFVFGALGSATDPASTMNVLWEYRAAGTMTTTLIAIVALDDALAMTLYGISTGVAQLLLGSDVSISKEILRITIEIFGAIGLGVAGGLIMTIVLRYVRIKEGLIAFIIGIILITIGLAQSLKMDIIIASMTLGIVLRNIAPERSKSLFKLVKSLSAPIYIFFFVLVGARLNISAMPWWMWLIIAVYCVGRNSGKIVGAWIGGKISRAKPVVRKYTGLGLSAQGGVAIGLAIIASQRFTDVYLLSGISLGETVVFVITATSLIFQIVGPPLVKLAARLSGELDKDLKEEDIIHGWKVKDAAQMNIVVLNEADTMKKVLVTFSENDLLVYPVTGVDGSLIGTISFEEIKDILINREVWDWIVAGDVCTRSSYVAEQDARLEDALETMTRIHAEQLPVVDEKSRAVGILDARGVHKLVENEIIERKKKQ